MLVLGDRVLPLAEARQGSGLTHMPKIVLKVVPKIVPKVVAKMAPKIVPKVVPRVVPKGVSLR